MRTAFTDRDLLLQMEDAPTPPRPRVIPAPSERVRLPRPTAVVLPTPAPWATTRVDPTLSTDALLDIIASLYGHLHHVPRPWQPARIAQIRAYADRYLEIEAHG